MATASSHKSYIARSQKIHAQIQLTYEEAVQSIDKLKTESSDDHLYLLREANAYADDLNKVVFNLAQVTVKFQIDNSKHARHDLHHIINTLCDLAGAIHRSFSYDHENVKAELKSNIKSAVHVAERLLAVIILDDIHEHKQEILNNQADVLFSIHRVLFTNQMKFLSVEQMRIQAQNEMDKIKTALLSFDLKDLNIGNKIIQCTNHFIDKIQGYNEHISKAITSDHFNDEIKNLFIDIIKILNANLEDLHKVMLDGSQAEQLIEDVKKNLIEAFATIAKLIPLLAAKENEQFSDSGMALIVYAYGYGVAMIVQMRKNLEYVKADN